MTSETFTLLLSSRAVGQPRRLRVPALVSVVAVVTAASMLAAVAADVPARDLVRDPAPYLGTPLHVGLLSTIGVLLWAAAAALALAAAVADGRLRIVAAVSALCAIDDAFLLHEEVWPQLTGLPEELALLPYAVLGVLLLRRLSTLEATPRRTFTLAVGVLGLSVVLDLIGSPLGLLSGTADDARNLTEELVKLGGITLWVLACWSVLVRGVATSTRRPG